ncbi:hypothetical protein CRV02_02755 [Arcobacter sp. CECT 8989]|uniref:hypothetical protein n=1 Tax=Arcobacter sp. CECT 8989 TaxID=2044509 RepID=UPI00100BB930|nr:hypothetical protein [Arcobacter sp. CECT 8989]RXK03056.1 hypothetical protein CRV02_02755 [Arcobacter sp. CECT 8989]
MKKLFKTTLIAAILGAIFSYGTLKFLYYKMEQELITYLVLNEEAKKLQDIYALCNGLLTTNPTKENLTSCNNIVSKAENISTQIEEKCPYISFYTTYINNLE